MKEEILSIASDLREGSMSTNEAKEQLLILFGVVGQSKQLKCDVCYQPTNNIKDDEGKRYCDSCEEL